MSKKKNASTLRWNEFSKRQRDLGLKQHKEWLPIVGDYKARLKAYAEELRKEYFKKNPPKQQQFSQLD